MFMMELYGTEREGPFTQHSLVSIRINSLLILLFSFDDIEKNIEYQHPYPVSVKM